MKKYIELMEHILPTENQKDNMFRSAMQSSEKPVKKSFRFKYCIVSLVLCFSISTAVFADEISETFYGLFNSDNIVGEEVLNDVFTDSNENIRMSVKEVLSDKTNSYAILEYILLNSDGEKWLNETLFINDLYSPEITPNIKDNNTALYGVNYAYGCNELEEYRTDTTRVFKAMYNASGENFSTGSIQLSYPMPERYKNITIIDVTESVQLTDIKIDNSLAPDKAYRPTGVKLSSMGLQIYGENHGFYEIGPHIQRIISDDEVDSLYIIMKDGTKSDILPNALEENICECGFMLGAVSNPELDYDIVIYTGTFPEFMDISLIEGIELDGVYYPLS